MMTSQNLPEKIEKQLSQQLPGIAAQRQMEPTLAFGRHAGPVAEDHRPAAVILLLYEHEDRWHLPLILRQPYLLAHPGQVSFPGGSLEADETSCHAAVRELHEELNVAPDEVKILGQLSPLYLFSTKFLITAWVGYCQNAPKFQLDENEVAAILEIPLTHFDDPQSRVKITHTHQAMSFSSPAYQWKEHQIWGATSMILSEFLAVMKQIS